MLWLYKNQVNKMAAKMLIYVSKIAANHDIYIAPVVHGLLTLTR